MEEIRQAQIQAFVRALYRNEKAAATIGKYCHAVESFARYLQGAVPSKERLLAYREYLAATRTARTVNVELTAIHAFAAFCGWHDLRVKYLKTQHRLFQEENRDLSRGEYERLLATARKTNPRLYFVMMTLGSTGIRISELAFITVEAVEAGRADIRLKGKCRTILLPRELCRKLKNYCREKSIRSGAVFRTRTGKPLDRSNIWHSMKALCCRAGVAQSKVFPHNFRHLFARVFYAIEKNIAHLADVLGHSRIETTRIYVATSTETHRSVLNRMRLTE